MKPSIPSQLLSMTSKKPLGWLTKFSAVGVALAAMAMPAARAIVLDTGTLTFSPAVGYTGILNLKDNDLIVRTGALATIVGYVTTGLYNGAGGYWDGPGINSSVAAAAVENGIGAILNPGYTMWPVDQFYNPAIDAHATGLGTEILVKFTWWGDSDLNGRVNPDDFTTFLDGFNNVPGATGWFNGDYDYNGVTNVDDFTLFLTGLNGPNTQLTPLVATAVPEPAGFALIASALIGMSARRSRKSSK